MTYGAGRRSRCRSGRWCRGSRAAAAARSHPSWSGWTSAQTTRDIPSLKPHSQSWRCFSRHTTSSGERVGVPAGLDPLVLEPRRTRQRWRPTRKSTHATRPCSCRPNWGCTVPIPSCLSISIVKALAGVLAPTVGQSMARRTRGDVGPVAHRLDRLERTSRRVPASARSSQRRSPCRSPVLARDVGDGASDVEDRRVVDERDLVRPARRLVVLDPVLASGCRATPNLVTCTRRGLASRIGRPMQVGGRVVADRVGHAHGQARAQHLEPRSPDVPVERLPVRPRRVHAAAHGDPLPRAHAAG